MFRVLHVIRDEASCDPQGHLEKSQWSEMKCAEKESVI